jgi:hypothetical protein
MLCTDAMSNCSGHFSGQFRLVKADRKRDGGRDKHPNKLRVNRSGEPDRNDEASDEMHSEHIGQEDGDNEIVSPAEFVNRFLSKIFS